MSQPNPLVEAWAKCYVGKEPLMDVGAAYGSNVAAAVAVLNEAHQYRTDDDMQMRFIAADFAPEHLKYIDETLGDEGVETVHCKLVSELGEADVAIAKYGGVSGILCSEVMHFLRGDEIDASLKWFYAKLVPGGRLFITTMSIFVSEAFGDINLWVRRNRDGRAQGRRWPISPGVTDDTNATSSDLNIAHEDAAFTVDVFDPQECFSGEINGMSVSQFLPTGLHGVGDMEMVRAIVDAGFELVSLEQKWRQGYPESARCDGRECVFVVAMKPIDAV